MALGRVLGLGCGTGASSPAEANPRGEARRPSTNRPIETDIKVAITPDTTSTVNYTAPVPNVDRVLNAADGRPVIGPRSWASIYGRDFAPAGFTDDWSNRIVGGKLTTSLDGVTVTVAGLPAYVSYVSAGHVDVLMPDMGLGPVPVTVTTPSGTSTPISAYSQQYSPAFLRWPKGQPVTTHADYSWAAADGTFPDSPTTPVKSGETVILWCTGLGPTIPPAPFDEMTPASPPFKTANPVTVTIGGIPATVYGSALASGFSGLYQIVLAIPTALPTGEYPVVASVNGLSTLTSVIAIRN
jgi:uncharacterized protein (TIGR03437 family)